jgi:serum/glucocorticoid-regulated kinase 2
MPAVVRSDEPQLQDVTASKKKFKTVLGLGNPVFNDDTIGRGHEVGQPRRPNYLTRRSTDAARSYNKKKRKQRHDRSGVTDTSFFEPDAIIIPSTAENNTPIPSVENMKPLDMNTSRRPPVRMDAQDGPWSVSVAETPHDARSYSLYIKSEFTDLFALFSSFSIWFEDNVLRL